MDHRPSRTRKKIPANETAPPAGPVGLKGIPASPGVAVGRAFLLDSEEVPIVKRNVPPAEIPQEITAAENRARGERLTDTLIEDIAQGYADAIEPLSDLRGSAWYRKQIIRVLARRAMQQVCAAN